MTERPGLGDREAFGVFISASRLQWKDFHTFRIYPDYFYRWHMLYEVICEACE